MRVNVYKEELTDRIEVITKLIDGHTCYGLRFYLELPVTVAGRYVAEGETPKPSQVRGPFIHHEGDDDSSAVTFWGSYSQMSTMLNKAIKVLDEHHANRNK